MSVETQVGTSSLAYPKRKLTVNQREEDAIPARDRVLGSMWAYCTVICPHDCDEDAGRSSEEVLHSVASRLRKEFHGDGDDADVSGPASGLTVVALA